MTFIWRYWACCTRHPLICVADNILHAVGVHWDRLCDMHEERITGE